jgi:hypothetical protein
MAPISYQLRPSPQRWLGAPLSTADHPAHPIYLEQVQKRPTQSPATDVRNILIPRFSQNPCTSCALLKTSAPLALSKNSTGSRAFIRNSALSWKSLRLLRFLQKPRANKPAALLSYRIFFYDFCMRKSFMPVGFSKTVCLKTPCFCIPHEDGTNMTPLP